MTSKVDINKAFEKFVDELSNRPIDPKFFTLAAKLEELNENKYKRIILHCREGVYDDYVTQVACPKIQMVGDLRTVGLNDLADKVIDGEYDQE